MCSNKDTRDSYNYRTEYLKRSPAICGYFICSICGKLIDKQHLHVDHIIPLAKGGKNRWLNTVATCAPCNLKKSVSVRYWKRSILAKCIETFIIVLKRFLCILFYITYVVLRVLIIALLFPLKCKIPWIYKMAYIYIIREVLKCSLGIRS